MSRICVRKLAGGSRALKAVVVAGFCSLVLGTGVYGRALDTVDLFTAERVIAQSADGARQREVLADALNEVFQRTAGRVDLPEHPALNEALDQPQNLMNRFSLNDSETTIPDAIGNPQPTYELDVEFAGALVRQTLAEAGIPVWSSLRPMLTLLLAGPNGDRIELLAPGSGYEPPEVLPRPEPDEPAEPGPAVVVPAQNRSGTASVHPLITDTQAWTRRLGLPVFWPVLDLQDRALLSPSILWAGDPEPLKALQARYNTAGVATGYLGFDAPSGQWVGRWRLLWGDEMTTVTLFADSREAVLRDGLVMVAEHIRSHFAIDFSLQEPNDYRVRVENLTNLDVYTGVRGYLMSLSGTEAVTLEQLSGDVATYRLLSRADPNVLSNLLALERKLVPLSQVGRATRPGDRADLQLFWRGNVR